MEQSRMPPFSRKAVLALLAGVSFAFAVLVKLFPFIFLPGFLMLVKKRVRTIFTIGFILGFTVLILPFLPEITNLFGTLNRYCTGLGVFRFSLPSIKKADFFRKFARLMLLFFFLCGTLFLYFNLWNKRFRVHHDENTDDFLHVIKTFYFVTITFLLLTTTLYPWYVLTLVAFLPFTVGAAGIVLSWAVFLSYRVLIAYTYSGRWIEDDFTPALIFLAPVASFLLVAAARKLTRQKSRHKFLNFDYFLDTYQYRPLTHCRSPTRS